ncbi:MAG TPA: 2Fe-2S iron-sulfur cluster-binding protein [Candidatus Acidoferrales bacterium]|nr:2Fe-2S iron-sulfur cluster-binding protein [Candidatus Acidoferrales bacterium]
MEADNRLKKSSEIPPKSHPEHQGTDFTRREFVATVGAVTGGMALGFRGFESSGTALAETPARSAHEVATEMVINGQHQNFSLDPRVTLLDLLREDLGLTGTKKGCDHGQCGACTVLANGVRINSCLSLAVAHDGDEITTIEGLAQGEQLHPVQQAFLEFDGFQCGYCTPGQICSAVALLHEAQRGDASFVTPDLARKAPAELTPDEIRERMSGNICRCGAYPGIVEAVQAGSRQTPDTTKTGGRP